MGCSKFSTKDNDDKDDKLENKIFIGPNLESQVIKKGNNLSISKNGEIEKDIFKKDEIKVDNLPLLLKQEKIKDKQNLLKSQQKELKVAKNVSQSKKEEIKDKQNISLSQKNEIKVPQNLSQCNKKEMNAQDEYNLSLLKKKK